VTQILKFLADHLGVLWRGARFAIVDSTVTTMFAGDSSLTVVAADPSAFQE
jgi:hypothetical protein